MEQFIKNQKMYQEKHITIERHNMFSLIQKEMEETSKLKKKLKVHGLTLDVILVLLAYLMNITFESSKMIQMFSFGIILIYNGVFLYIMTKLGQICKCFNICFRFYDSLLDEVKTTRIDVDDYIYLKMLANGSNPDHIRINYPAMTRQGKIDNFEYAIYDFRYQLDKDLLYNTINLY